MTFSKMRSDLLAPSEARPTTGPDLEEPLDVAAREDKYGSTDGNGEWPGATGASRVS